MRCEVFKREAGYSRALASTSPGPHLSLQMLSAACLLATWESLEVVFASIADLLLNPEDSELQESSPRL